MKKVLLLVISAIVFFGGITTTRAYELGQLTLNFYASFEPEELLGSSKITVQSNPEKDGLPNSIMKGTGKKEYYYVVNKNSEYKNILDKKILKDEQFENFKYTNKISFIKPTDEQILNNFSKTEAGYYSSDFTTPYTPGEVDVYLIFERVSSDIKWLDQDDKLIKEEKIPYNTIVTTPDKEYGIYKRYGYEYKGVTVEALSPHFKESEKKFDLGYIKTDLAIRPIYEPLKYTITFVDKDGKILSEEEYSYNDKIIYPETAPDVVGMNFVKWSSESDVVRQDKTIRPIYAPIEVDEIEITKNMVIDDTYFDNGVANVAKFDKLIENAKLAELKYGESSLTMNLNKDKRYSISRDIMEQLALFNVNLSVNFDDVRTKVNDLTSLVGELEMESKEVNFTKSIVNADYTYKPVSKAFNLNVTIDGVPANLTYQVDGNYSNNNFIIYMNGETPTNIEQYLGKEFNIDGENEFKVITERTLVVSGEESNFIDNVVSYVKSIPTETLIIAGLASLVVVLGVGILFSRKK